MVTYKEKISGKECYNSKGYYIGMIYPHGGKKYKYHISLINGHYEEFETLEQAKKKIEKLEDRGLFILYKYK